MKAVRLVIVVLVVGIGGLLVLRNVIAKVAVTSAVKAVTGLGLNIRRMDVGLLNTRLHIQGLQVLNPAGFHEPTMVDIPEIYVDYDPGALLKGAARLEEVRLHLNEMTVVKNERGDVNLNTLRAVRAGKEQAQVPQEKKRPTAKPPQITVDELELHIGRVVYKDYSTPTPQTRSFNVNIHERFHNIANPYALAGLIVTRAMAKTTIANLTNVDLGALQSEVTNIVRTSLGQVGGMGKEALTTTEEAVKGTTNALKKLLGQ